MRIRKGRLRLSPNEEAQLLKEETEKRRKLRLQQVREQSKENAAQIRKAVKQEKHRQLMKLANDIKNQLESEKAERVRHLEQQYDNSLRNIGVGHKQANDQPDWTEERELVRQAENLRAEARGRSAIERHNRETELKNQDANKVNVARRNALEAERVRAREVADMPPPPPDPLQNIQPAQTRPVKVTDMNTFSTSHYHLQNEHAVDRADPQEQPSAKEAAELEQERIHERALELRRLRQDQLERARLRHNQALEKELLKHDYNNILHDLSDLQRADRERRLKVVHHIPKQVFEPPNFRMEDREDRQRQMEQVFEDMYMAGTDHMGDLSLAFDPQPRPLTPTREDSLDVTGTDTQTPLQEPSLPQVPPVLRDMTNMPHPKSPGKKPEKVLRNLMDRIKSQREEWMTSHSMIEVGDGVQHGMGPAVPMELADTSGADLSQFQPLIPEPSPAPVLTLPTSAHTHAQPTFSQPGYPLATVSQPGFAPPTVSQTGFVPPHANQAAFAPPQSSQATFAPATLSQAAYAPPPGAPPQTQPAQNRMTAMAPDVFAEKLRETNEKQQTNIQLQPDLNVQQAELLQILKQQETILEQKRQLELKLQHLTHEQQKLQLTNQAAQPQPSSAAPHSVQAPYGQSVPGPTAAPQGPQIQATAAMSSQGLVPNVQTGQGGGTSVFPQQQVPQQQPFASLPSQPGQSQAPPPQMMSQATSQAPVMNGLPPASVQLQQQFASSLSSSGMSQQPMNSIPPTHGTTTLPIATTVGQGQYPGYPVRSAYQPPSAVLTTDQLAMPAYSQPQPIPQSQYHPGSISMATAAPSVSMATNQEVPFPEAVPPTSLTEDIHSEQMRKVKEYQQHLLARHEQSKKVLEETKAEIKRRRENLLERYPKLDLSRLENLGAKYLQNGTQLLPQPGIQVQPVIQGHPVSQGHLDSQGQGQPADPGQAASISALLATLASHPYYKATLSLPDNQKRVATMPLPATTITVASVHQTTAPMTHPDMDMDTNLRKNKFDHIRKSLPFDQDESFQTPIRVYEAYAQKELDTTSATELTDGDTSTLTSKGSPSLPPASRQGRQSRTTQEEEFDSEEETDMDTTASDKEECLTRQGELRRQLAEIQRQKEEIMKRTELGQQKLSRQEGELKAKLASISPEELGQQLADGIRSREKQLQSQPKSAPVQKELFDQPSRSQQSNLSTILEVDTPVSTRPSDSGRLSTSSSEGGSITVPSKRTAQPMWSRSEVIAEEPGLEDVETQMETDARKKTSAKVETVAEYSGKNISDVLERAKRFESEVLEKLRRQTNAVLFDNEFDDSLEFNVSRRQVSADTLSTGSLSTSSLSTGPLEDSSISKPNESDLKSANGSFKTSAPKSWAAELSQYKMPASDQSDPSFKILKPESNRSSLENTTSNGETMFVDKNNRFKVYAAINQPGSPEDLDLGKINGEDINAQDVIKLLREMQKEFRNGEEARQLLVKKLVEQQNLSMESKREPSPSFDKREQVSRPFMTDDSKDGNVSRPFMSDQSKSELSQYSFSDKSTDVSLGHPSPVDNSRRSPIQSGTSSKEKEILIRRSPIGDNARTVSPAPSARRAEIKQPDTSGTEYSFTMTSGSQRSTSTPGEDRQKSVIEAHTSTNRSELPSEITIGDRSNRQSVKFQDESSASLSASEFKQLKAESKSPADGLDWSSSRDEITTSQFDTLSTDTKRTSGDLSTFSLTTAEESLQSIKREFDKFKPKEKGPEKIKTYAVSRSGELISEHSDSDKSLRRTISPSENLTTFSISKGSVDSRKKTSSAGLSSYSMKDDSATDQTQSTLSQYTLTSSVPSESSDSNVKSSSLTTVTSDQSMNATGASMLSLKESVSSSIDDNGNNYIQQRFASLDNLISESKNLIERHKNIIDKNKQPEPVPSQPPKKAEGREITTKPSVIHSFPKPFYTSANKNESNASTDSDFSKITSVDTDQSIPDISAGSQSLSQDKSRNQSVAQDISGDQSSSMDMNSLDYLTEHSSGIMEEPLPDLQTLGSEMSISEAFMKTEDLSDSGDSLQSFEKHELSESESLATSRSAYEDESTQDHSKSDSLQDIVEARRHNFMVQSERRAAAAKERALARTSPDDGQVFRAVPVNVVAMPTLSMSVSTGTAEKAKPSKTLPTKGAQSFGDKRTVFENKEKESQAVATNKKSLNRALQPRGPDSPQPKDSGMKPSFKSFEQSKFQRSSSSEEKQGLGKLAGEIRQFGGTSGLNQKASSPSPKKTPPKTLPKPVRSKPQATQPKSSAPGASGLSKTLSTWKKSRAITSKPTVPEPASNREAPKNSIKVLPQDAPVPLTDEERRKKAEDELYEKNIRAYNPRLFRLQHKLDTTTDDTDTQPEKHAERRETRKGKARF